jgi:uncharacterized protein YbjQ (UPF0145 family)
MSDMGKPGSSKVAMMVVTTEELAGYEIRTVVGEVMGICARTNNPYLEGIRQLDGENNPKMTAALAHWREEAVAAMMEAAHKRGANAIVAMRFDNRVVTEFWIELCAYGTAVIATRAAVPAPVAENAGRDS